MIKRSFILAMLSLLALISSIIVGLGTYLEAQFVLRGYVDATREVNLPYRQPRLGVNVDLTQYDAVELERQLQLMEEARIVWVRQVADWRSIEPQRGQFQWEVWDKLTSAIGDKSLKLVVVFMNTPDWAQRHAPTHPTAPPSEIEDFKRFISSFVERYKDVVDYYQVWDEPNIRLGWGDSDPNPIEYSALLCDAYNAIHSQDPYATVLAAALAPTVEAGPRNLNEFAYLSRIYAHGASQCFDGVAAKPYGFNLSPMDRTVDVNTLNFSRIIALREIMVDYGDAKKPLWASNWGWNSLPQTWEGPPSIWGSVDFQTRIDYTKEAYRRAQREWPWLGGLILQHWQPNAPPQNPIWGFSVIDTNNQPTALYDALLELGQKDTHIATDGLYHPANPYARYSGVWTFGPLGADIGWLEQTDSYIEFDFYGRDIALLVRKDNYIAFLYPSIDGKAANALPRDNAGNAYILLRSATLSPELQLVLTGSNLSLAAHTLALIPDKGWDRWALAGFAVSSGNLAQPYYNQISIAILAIGLSSLAVISAFSRATVSGVVLNHLWALFARRLDNIGQIVIGFVTSIALMLSVFLTWGDGTPQFLRRDHIQLGLALITAGLIYLEPPLILMICSAVILFILIYNRLELGLMLVLFWAPFFLFPVELWQFAFPMAEILLLLTSGAWVLKGLAAWGKRRQAGIGERELWKASSRLLHLGDILVLAWLVLGMLAITWSFYTRQAITDFRVIFLEPILFYAICRTLPLTPKVALNLLDTLMISASVICIISILMLLTNTGIITAEAGAIRLAGVYGSPNNLALLLGRIIPIAFAFFIVHTDKRRTIIAGVSSTLMIAAMFMTQSVGGIILGLPAALTAVIIIRWGRKAVKPLLVLMFVGVVGLIIAVQLSPRFAGLFDMTRGTNFFRLRVWESALEIIQDYPLTGIGLDQFLYRFRSEYIRPDAIWDRDLSHPHNFILDIWARLGLFGVGLFIAIQLCFWRYLTRLLQMSPPPLMRAMLMSLAGGMAATLAHGLIDNSIFVFDLAYVFFAHLAIITTLANIRPIDLNTS